MAHDFALSRGDLDSATYQRDEVDLAAELTFPNARVIVMDEGGRFAVTTGLAGTSLWLPPSQRVAGLQGDDPWRGWFLGRGQTGEPIVAVVAPDEKVQPLLGGAKVSWADLTDFAPHLVDHRDSLLATQSAAIFAWQSRTRSCQLCGGPLRFRSGGWTAVCARCGHIEYPRTDPAIIAAVTDPGDRLLLVHNVLWEPKRMSLPAGYVDAGESVERAVQREMREEVSLEVADLRYLGSQPWPRPRSLMLAFAARTQDTRPVADEVEVDRAHFFEREELVEKVASQELVLPGPAAVAHTIIQSWLEEDL